MVIKKQEEMRAEKAKVFEEWYVIKEPVFMRNIFCHINQVKNANHHQIVIPKLKNQN